MPKSKDLSEYITTIKPIKPSAEVVFRTQDENGETVESSASREYVAEHAEKEFDVASQVEGLAERLAAKTQAVADRVAEADDLDEQLVEDAEYNTVEQQGTSPLTNVPNGYDGGDTPPSTSEMSETQMLIMVVQKLCDKIDQMQNFNPVIHVPAPVIHVTLPETRKTVTKAVERDENNFIKTVRESVVEEPVGEPLIEVAEEPKPKRKRRTKKDNE